MRASAKALPPLFPIGLSDRLRVKSVELTLRTLQSDMIPSAVIEFLTRLSDVRVEFTMRASLSALIPPNSIEFCSSRSFVTVVFVLIDSASAFAALSFILSAWGI